MGEMELTPSGEWLNSDVVTLREGLNNIKGRVWGFLYGKKDEKKGGEEKGDEKKGKMGEMGEMRGVLVEVYEECERVLWGVDGELGDVKMGGEEKG